MNITQINKILREKMETLIKDYQALVTTTVLDSKIKEDDNKMPHIFGLVKKTDYDAKIPEIEGKYFTTFYNKFMSEILDAKIKQI